MSGMIISHIITMWIVFGSTTIDKDPHPMLPLSTEDCNNESFSAHIFPMYNTVPNSIQGGIQWVNKTDSRNLYTDDTVQSTSLHKDR